MSAEELNEDQWNDATSLFKTACSELSEGNYVASSDFKIDEAVHAFEVMQPILDSGLDANKIKCLEKRLEDNDISFDYKSDDVLRYIIMLSMDEDSWLVGWSLTRFLSSYIPCYEIVLKKLNELVQNDKINSSLNLNILENQYKLNRLFVLTYTVLFLRSIKYKIELCKEAKNVERDNLDCYTKCYLLDDNYSFSINVDLLLSILNTYLNTKVESSTSIYNTYYAMMYWLKWRYNHIQSLDYYLNKNSNLSFNKICEEEDIYIQKLKDSFMIKNTFEQCKESISSSLFDLNLFKIVSLNIPTNVPKYSSIHKILDLNSSSNHTYMSISIYMTPQIEFIEMFENLSHILYQHIYSYVRAALYVYFIRGFLDFNFDWNDYICRCCRINKTKQICQKFDVLITIFKDTMKETIHSLCYLPSLAYKQLPVLLEQWVRFYENLVCEINLLSKEDPVYIYLVANQIQKNLTHFILNTCCFILILYCYMDIYLKLTTKYEIGFMVWYLTILINKVKDIESKFESEQQQNRKNKRINKKFNFELSSFPKYINSFWIVNYTYLLSFLYVYSSSKSNLIQDSSYTYANESIRILQKIAPINKSLYLPIPTYKNYIQSYIFNNDFEKNYTIGYQGFSQLFQDLNKQKHNENDWLRKKEFSDIQLLCLKMTSTFMKAKPYLNFNKKNESNTQYFLELDETHINQLPLLQQRL